MPNSQFTDSAHNNFYLLNCILFLSCKLYIQKLFSKRIMIISLSFIFYIFRECSGHSSKHGLNHKNIIFFSKWANSPLYFPPVFSLWLLRDLLGRQYYKKSPLLIVMMMLQGFFLVFFIWKIINRSR